MIYSMGGIYQRDGKWYYRYRYKGRLVRESLAKHGVSSEAQARAYKRQVEKEGIEKRLAELDPSTKTLGQLREEYIEHRRPLGLAKDTLRRDDQALRSLASFVGERCLLRTLTQRKIQQWAGHLLAGNMAPTTVNSYLRHIRAALNTALEWKWLNQAPKLKSVKQPERFPRALTPEEMEKILALELNPERRALWEFCLWTGVRRQEALDLTWQDVHLESESPWVRVVGKGNKEGMVPLLPQAVQALQAMPKADVGPVWRFHFRGYVNPKPVTGSPVSRWFKEAVRRAGIEDAHLHDLRHTAATWMAARGVPERIIQEIMRHASITTTQIYTRGVARVADLYKHMSHGLVSQKEHSSK
ncbi:MAG: tyrosine-type recombinase/integrase [Pseudomonadota bacterium]